MSKDPKHPGKGHVDRATQDLIGHQLRAMYSDLLSQPLPEKIASTLRTIGKAEEAVATPQHTLRRAA
jgi:Anti-sigma factor NepR